jgi:catechol 2,3-dioxygenase-like lactoylglutathione lyase family enzyme
MKRVALATAIVLLVSGVAASPGDLPKRPRILGIARVQVFVTDISASRSFYSKIFNQAGDCNWCEKVSDRNFMVNLFQRISLPQMPSPAPSNLIEEITFATDDVPKLRRYFIAHHIAVNKPNKPEDDYLRVVDPEGHQVGFVRLGAVPSEEVVARLRLQIPFRIIHAGFIVRHRAAEDAFYKDILGFRVYWHGGMNDSETDWVDMQVPDGTDWLEYMLNVSPEADQHTRGVMNHLAIGIPDIKATTERLRDEGVVPILEEPKIGRDGKWQLNFYDPDGTRVEFMEFTPTQKPCCSEYTGPHPGPKP